jgi:hypothetical protein
MMLHQDGSRHEWLAGHDAMDLIVTMDDATSEIYSAFLTPEEGTASTFRALLAVFATHGLPLSLDRLVKELALAGIKTVEAANVAMLSNFGPPPVPHPTVTLMDQGAFCGLESQSGFIRAAPS